MSADVLNTLAAAHAAGAVRGITSVCSAHPLVVEAALVQAAADGQPLLVEATSNQVNQLGGYTGLTPLGFRDHVLSIAARLSLGPAEIILGGDHLGPNPWRHLPAETALTNAETMVHDYVAAGFQKIHLDTSMGCRGEPECLPDAVTAQRAARLVAVAERAALPDRAGPQYVVGTEVPKPGGATETLRELEVTSPQAAVATFDTHRRAFAAVGMEAAFERVIALVVQPGVEFGHDAVITYQPARAGALSRALAELPGVVFEAHSTDYQPPDRLAALVRDGFAILKVGPALTFAMREALYALDYIRSVLEPAAHGQRLIVAMESVMLRDPAHWRTHYPGDDTGQRVLRHFSYSDRIRYYWPAPAAMAAVAALFDDLAGTQIPETLVSQFLPRLYPRVMSGALRPTARDLVMQAIRDVLRPYADASVPAVRAADSSMAAGQA